jgi:uncharacterized membrane protein (DUF2068 family)
MLRSNPSAPTTARAGATDGGRPPRERRKHTHGILLVGVFKLSKTILFSALGITCLRLLHRNLTDVVLHWTDKLPLDPTGRVVSLVLEKTDLIGSRQLVKIGIAALAYAAVCLVEGTGLMLEKVWAEYITTVLTALALPWEIYELIKRPSAFRVGLLLLNVVVLVYLIWFLRSERRKQAAEPVAAD